MSEENDSEGLDEVGTAEDGELIDFYELLQISPNAEVETINRVYRLLAARYHPDNPETGNPQLFLLLKQARETLCDPNLRAEYDTLLEVQSQQPLGVFSLREFAKGFDGEANRRMGVLCLLYNRRRVNVDEPGMSVLELENLMSCPREHLMFALWYLREKDCVAQDEHSNFVLTGDGADYVEEHVPKHDVLYRLLKAAETGEGRRQGPASSETESRPSTRRG